MKPFWIMSVNDSRRYTGIVNISPLKLDKTRVGLMENIIYNVSWPLYVSRKWQFVYYEFPDEAWLWMSIIRPRCQSI